MSDELVTVEAAGVRWDVVDGRAVFASMGALLDFWEISESTYIRTGSQLDWGDADKVEAGWWAKHSGRKNAPAWIERGRVRLDELRGEVEGAGGNSSEDDFSDNCGEDEAVEDVVLGGDGVELSGEGWGFRDQVVFQRRLVRSYAETLQKRMRLGGDISGVDAKYQKALGILRSMEKDLVKWEVESGRAWERDEVVEAVSGVLAGVNGGLEVLAERLRKKLDLEEEGVRLVRNEVDALRRTMAGLEYARTPADGELDLEMESEGVGR